jgi:hypothetical protein
VATSSSIPFSINTSIVDCIRRSNLDSGWASLRVGCTGNPRNFSSDLDGDFLNVRILRTHQLAMKPAKMTTVEAETREIIMLVKDMVEFKV